LDRAWADVSDPRGGAYRMIAAGLHAGADLRSAARREARLKTIAVGATLAVGFGIVFLIYAPVLWLGVLSISDDPLSGRTGSFTLKWYRDLFAQEGWLDPLIRSIEIAAAVSLLCVIAALAVGRVLPRMRRGQALLLGAFLIPLVVPGIVTGIDMFIFYRVFAGLKMGAWSLILCHFTWAFPFALLGMLVVSIRFDFHLVEAAADLGAGSWRRFWDIERPLLMPGIVSAGLFGFLLSLTELPRSLYVYGRFQTLPLFTWAEASARASHVPLIYCLNALISVVSVGLGVLAVWQLGRRAKS
jgi:ABC-type spermidine/putrescine transport system permease subunit II